MSWLKLKTPGKFTNQYVWYAVLDITNDKLYRFWPNSIPQLPEKLSRKSESVELLEEKFAIELVTYEI